jgi:hypothetical protein
MLHPGHTRNVYVSISDQLTAERPRDFPESHRQPTGYPRKDWHSCPSTENVFFLLPKLDSESIAFIAFTPRASRRKLFFDRQIPNTIRRIKFRIVN